MDEDDSSDMLKEFKLDSEIVDVQVQLCAVNRLPKIAKTLGEEATREELVPYLKEYLNKIYCFDEVQMHLALVLADIFPYLGGSEHVEVLFDLFDILASTNETPVREATIQSLIKIAEQLDFNTLNGPFIDFMTMLLEKEWSAPKSSAVGLFTTLYPRVPEDKKNFLREQYLKLFEEESTKKIAVMNLNSFSKVLEEEYVDTVALGLLVLIASDDQDTMKTHSVELIVDISKILKPELVKDHVVHLIHKLSGDIFWKVRQTIARKLTDLQSSIGQDLTKENLIKVARTLSEDTEVQVREALAENLVRFTITLQNNTENPILEPKIETDLIPIITRLYYDPSAEVSTKISATVMDLIQILDQDKIKKYLVPIFSNLDKQTIDEVFINNLNKLIITIGLEDMESSVLLIMFKLLATPERNWRARRGLVITIKTIMARCDADNFTKTIIPFYQKLLSDQIYSIRRTAPVILPMMIRKYGMTWAKSHLLNNIFCFTGHKNYLYRYIVLFCIDEIIEPTLQIDKKAHLSHVDNPEKLFRIYYLKEILEILLYESWIEDLIGINNSSDLSDEINLYAEDTLEYLIQENVDVFSQPVNEHGEDYLESVLHLLVKYVLEIIKELSADRVENVRNRSAHTIKKIFKLNSSLQEDFNDVEDILNGISEDVRDVCRRDVHSILCLNEDYMNFDSLNLDRGKHLKKNAPSGKVDENSNSDNSNDKNDAKNKKNSVDAESNQNVNEEIGVINEDSVLV